MSRTNGWATIRPLIEENLKGVDAVGRVHPFIRHERFWDKYIQDHVKDGVVNSWEFTRVQMPNGFADIGDRTTVGCIFHRVHIVRMVGRLALDDGGETELRFQDIVDDVIEAFEGDVLLGGRLVIGNPPSIEEVGHQSYGGVLVHRAQILFSATERVGKSL